MHLCFWFQRFMALNPLGRSSSTSVCLAQWEIYSVCVTQWEIYASKSFPFVWNFALIFKTETKYWLGFTCSNLCIVFSLIPGKQSFIIDNRLWKQIFLSSCSTTYAEKNHLTASYEIISSNWQLLAADRSRQRKYCYNVTQQA